MEKIARVVVDLALDKAFDYLIPGDVEAEIFPGSQVAVPFGRGRRLGFVLSVSDESELERSLLKPLAGLAENKIRIPEPLVKLGIWMASYYCCSQEQAVRALLPGAVRSGKIKHRKENFYFPVSAEAAREYAAKESSKANAAKRIKILNYLLEEREASSSELTGEFGDAASALVTLERHGLIKKESRIVERGIFGGEKVILSPPKSLTGEQLAALNTIRGMFSCEAPSHVLLLWGVTNSGKTEVYMQAIEEVVRSGKSAIMLVPEISLTPQTVRRFRARFGDNLSVLHSGLSEGERFDQWSKIARGEAKIAIGARSALFAPFADLGLIIVDEEHEGSYKQSETPRYHARDVAVMRGKMENAVVILGSATPSAESMENAANGKYLMARMQKKVADRMEPAIHLIDQRLNSFSAPEKNKEGETEERLRTNLFSPFLKEKINACLSRGGQSILFLNRRGYARTMSCDLCGYEAACEHCSVSLVYSKRSGSLNCHWCGHSETAPEKCPNCGDANIRYSGIGTEKVEAIAAKLFPSARIGRMDSDTMRSADDYETILDKFRRGQLDILIGTQMIAKGLHFPNVTLVGILNADQNLNVDFRSPERTFQLITQVAGRSGRGEQAGEVVVQSFQPDNETIRAAANGDFEVFQEYDLEARKFMKYPPFSHLIMLHFEGENEEAVASYALQVSDYLKKFAAEETKIIGPKPSPLERLKGKWRYQVIIHGNKLQALKKILRQIAVAHPKNCGVDFHIDVDALSML